MNQPTDDSDLSTRSPTGETDEKFRQVMESRWRYAVFPAMVTFVLLIGFMFYLIYGMLQRMEDLSEDIDKMTNVISDSLPVMQGGVVSMSSRMQWVGDDLKKMTADVNNMSQVLTRSMPAMTRSIDGMTADVSNMTRAADTMSATTYNMGQNLWDMNRNISGGPFGMMKDIMPFSKKSAPPPRPYYGYSQQPYASWYYPQQTWSTAAAGGQVVTAAATPEEQQLASIEAGAQNPHGTDGQGSSKYAGFCASCHGTNGGGGVGPSLKAHKADSVVAVLEQYRSGELKGTMTGVAKEMTDHDIHTIAEFVEASL